MAYIPNTFCIEVEETDDWKELLDLLKTCGFKKYEPPLFDGPTKPLTTICEPLIGEPTCLKFYLNYKYSEVKK